MKLTDKRTRLNKDIVLLLAFIAGMIACGVSIKVGVAIANRPPSWAEQQVPMFLSPCPLDGCDVIEKEATRSLQNEESVESYQLSDRALDCVANYPQTAKKIQEKFGKYSQYAIELYARESSLNHLAVNPSSQAGGIIQALPFSKTGCTLEDLGCQLDWGYTYIEQRYGNAKNALEFQKINNYY